MPLQPGTRLGNYEVLSDLGSGGMGGSSGGAGVLGGVCGFVGNKAMAFSSKYGGFSCYYYYR